MPLAQQLLFAFEADACAPFDIRARLVPCQRVADRFGERPEGETRAIALAQFTALKLASAAGNHTGISLHGLTPTPIKNFSSTQVR